MNRGDGDVKSIVIWEKGSLSVELFQRRWALTFKGTHMAERYSLPETYTIEDVESWVARVLQKRLINVEKSLEACRANRDRIVEKRYITILAQAELIMKDREGVSK